MRQLYLAVMSVVLSMLALSNIAYGAGSVSGNLIYTGSQAGTIYVAAFNSIPACTSPNPDPYAVIEIPAIGTYTVSGLPDGTYYMVAVIITGGADADMKHTDPWGIYNGCSNVFPIVISGGNTVSGIDITLADGTNQAPNPFYSNQIYYHFNVTGNATGHFDIYKWSNELSFEHFGLTGDGGGAYSGVEIIIPFGSHSAPLNYVPPKVGQMWSDSGYTDIYLVNATSTVTSVTETVSVTAGTFHNCAKVVETYSYPNGAPPYSYQTKEDRWFCPGIGPVKFVITHNDGSQYSGQLTSYQNITATANDYFPLGLNYSWTFTMNDGRTNTWVITSESTYEDIVFSGHDVNGYWSELLIEDPAHTASSVSVTGPGIAGSLDLVYDADRGMWTSVNHPWWATPPALPADYYLFKITDAMGPTYRTDSLSNFVDVFVTNLSPSGGEAVTGNPVFSWTGVSGDYTYGVELDDSSGNRIWQAHYLRTASAAYTGPALTEGATYYYNVLVKDSEGNISVVRESFVYGTAQLSFAAYDLWDLGSSWTYQNVDDSSDQFTHSVFSCPGLAGKPACYRGTESVYMTGSNDGSTVTWMKYYDSDDGGAYDFPDVTIGNFKDGDFFYIDSTTAFLLRIWDNLDSTKKSVYGINDAYKTIVLVAWYDINPDRNYPSNTQNTIVESNLASLPPFAGSAVTDLDWYAPGVGKIETWDVEARNGDLVPGSHYRLIDYVNCGNSLKPSGADSTGDNVCLDFDNDGLPNDWEINNGFDPADDGSINPANGPNGNPDNDGASNIDEYKAGSDPRNPDSRPVDVTIEIHSGLNMFSYPATRTGGLTSYELLTLLGNSDEIDKIQIYDKSARHYKESYYDGTYPAGDNVSLEFGDGILVYSKVNKTLSFNSTKNPFNSYVECAAIDLVKGLNVTAFPCAPAEYSAHDLLSDLGEANVASVSHYDAATGMMKTAVYTNSQPAGADFDIKAGEAYFIYMKEVKSNFKP